jgi:hypothetical protein
MNKSRLSSYTFCSVILSLLAANSISLCFPLLSIAYEVYGPEKHYRSCAQLQKRINDNNPTRTVKGFERAELMRKTLAENAYVVYCNGGTIINRDNGTVCRGYIGYGYSPSAGTAGYYGSWGWTDGFPNDADTGKERYCRKLK